MMEVAAIASGGDTMAPSAKADAHGSAGTIGRTRRRGIGSDRISDKIGQRPLRVILVGPFALLCTKSSIEGPIVRTTYADIHRRSLKVAQRLERDGYGLFGIVLIVAGTVGCAINPVMLPSGPLMVPLPKRSPTFMAQPDEA